MTRWLSMQVDLWFFCPNPKNTFVSINLMNKSKIRGIMFTWEVSGYEQPVWMNEFGWFTKIQHVFCKGIGDSCWWWISNLTFFFFCSKQSVPMKILNTLWRPVSIWVIRSFTLKVGAVQESEKQIFPHSRLQCRELTSQTEETSERQQDAAKSWRTEETKTDGFSWELLKCCHVFFFPVCACRFVWFLPLLYHLNPAITP